MFKEEQTSIKNSDVVCDLQQLLLFFCNIYKLTAASASTILWAVEWDVIIHSFIHLSLHTKALKCLGRGSGLQLMTIDEL